MPISPLQQALPVRRRQRTNHDPLHQHAASLHPQDHALAIQRSHERSIGFGLSRGGGPTHEQIGRPDLSLARDLNWRLHAHAAPVMEMLHEQIANTHSMIVLGDAHGVVLHSIGDDDFLERAAKVALQPGADWSEQSKGTNGVGTALVNEAPTLVHAGEHFLHAHRFLTCSAVPVFDARGNTIGVLDVTGDHRSYHRHTMGLVRMSVRIIENQWLGDHFHDAMRLHLQCRPELIGTLMEGIVAVGRDGRLVGANRKALDLLGLSMAALRMHSVSSLLGTALGVLVDRFRSPMATPLKLSLPNGGMVHVRARFSWPAVYGIGRRAGDVPTGAFDTAAPIAPPAFAAVRSEAAGLQCLQSGDAQFDAVLDKVRRVIDRDIPVLLLGETGTGKELLARAMHAESSRARQPFVAVNCASIPEALIEAELFGYEEGAFTGARRKGAPGRIVQASGGTLFLDEIGDMPLALQARLLRVLQERLVLPLGSSKSIAVDVAIIGATYRDLCEMIERGAFREDLYYRLNGLVVKLPPLRERSDLEQIVRNILRAESPARDIQVSEDVMRLMRAYRWPGNIRHLASVLRTAVVMAAGQAQITRAHLSDDFLDDAARMLDGDAAQQLHHAVSMPAGLECAAPEQPNADETVVAPVLPASSTTLGDVELATIRQALEAADGNISLAAKRLGISRNTVYRRLRWRSR